MAKFNCIRLSNVGVFIDRDSVGSSANIGMANSPFGVSVNHSKRPLDGPSNERIRYSVSGSF